MKYITKILFNKIKNFINFYLFYFIMLYLNYIKEYKLIQ